MTGAADEQSVKAPQIPRVARAMHAADDRRLAVVVLFSCALLQLYPPATPLVLTALMLAVWNSLERHVSIFNSSFALQRQQSARMRLDFVAGLFVVVAYLFAIARTVSFLVGEDAVGPSSVLFFCCVGAAMCWVVFNQGWQFSKALVAFAFAASACLLALTIERPARDAPELLQLASKFARIALLSAALHAITWRSLASVRLTALTQLPVNWIRTAAFIVLLTFAVESPDSVHVQTPTERWLWVISIVVLLATVVVEMLQARADLTKEWRALAQVVGGISVPPRRRRLGIWTQAAMIPASMTVGISTWLEWGICLVCGMLAAYLALPRLRPVASKPAKS